MLIQIAAMLMVAAAPTPPVVPTNVVADPNQILNIMRADGYEVELKDEEDGSKYLRASKGKESYTFSVYFYGCAEKTTLQCKSVQFASAFSPKKKPTLQAMNDYAQSNRWGRIYLDSVGDPVLEMDVDLEKGGMTPALLLDNLEYFEAVTDRFATFVFSQ